MLIKKPFLLQIWPVEPVDRVFLKHSCDQDLHIHRHIFGELHFLAQNFGFQLVKSLRVEGSDPLKEFIDDNAKRPDVNLMGISSAV